MGLLEVFASSLLRFDKAIVAVRDYIKWHTDHTHTDFIHSADDDIGGQSK